MAAGAALPGLFFTFAAMVLLVFVSVSAPTWNDVSFLNAGGLRYGVFGFTGSQTHIGYDFQGIPSRHPGAINALTKALILHPIAAALAGIAWLFGICGAGYHRLGTVFMSLAATLAALITLVIWVIDMVIFGIARHDYRSAGIPAQYGNANWLTLGALVALWLAACTAGVGVFGHYRNPRY